MTKVNYYALIEDGDDDTEHTLAHVVEPVVEGGNGPDYPVVVVWAGEFESIVLWTKGMVAFRRISLGEDRNIRFPKPRRLDKLTGLPFPVDTLRAWANWAGVIYRQVWEDNLA